MGEVFYWIFNMSIIASICGVFILLIRCFKKIPRRFLVILWLIPFIRMCLPVGITGKYGIMSLISKFTTKSVIVYEIGDATFLTMMNSTMAAEGYFPLVYKFKLIDDVFSIASIIWLVVLSLLILLFSLVYFSEIKKIKDSTHYKDNIYFSNKVNYPSVYGIIKPKIIIPYEYKESNIDYIIMHERTHIKRLDNFFRVASFLITCVHWFNPLSWLFLKLLYNDMELACDETVISKCNETEIKEYANTLLSSLEKSSIIKSNLGGAKIRTRIKNILSYKNLTVLSVIGFSSIIVIIAYILLTNAI
ncbi:MAG: peptidase M56 BlaR1 [Clostridia bacterium]|nr:peptidase M56 BlaR1 [Clostridia bacterium]